MGSYLQRIWDCRYFWLSLVKMDIRTRYRGSILGLGWSLLQPIGFTIILCVVFGKIFRHDVTYYGPYVLSGYACWTFIVAAGVQGCYCFRIAETYIRRYPAPMAIYPLRFILGQGFHLIISMGIVLVLAVVLRGIESPLSLLSLIPSMVLLLTFGWSLTVISALVATHFPDAEHMSELVFRCVFYLTPVMLTDKILKDIGMFQYYQLNPVTWFLRLLRRTDSGRPHALVEAVHRHDRGRLRGDHRGEPGLAEVGETAHFPAVMEGGLRFAKRSPAAQ